MKALVITKFGGPEVLSVRDIPKPTPGPDEVVVSVARAGVNFSDLAARQGLYPDAPKPPMVMGYEVAGTVAASGANVKAFRVGDRVVALTRFKGQAEQVAVPGTQVFALPASLDFDAAAALPVSYLTAYQAVFQVARVRAGDRVLIHMAAGGLGLAVIALCQQVGGVELFGTASKAKHDFLRLQGVQHPIDYRTEDYGERVRTLTHGEGVDVVVDPLGGADWKKGYELLRPGGRLVACGWANMNGPGKRSLLRVVRQLWRMPKFTPIQVMNDNRGLSGINVGKLWGETGLIRASMTGLLGDLAAGKIKPHIDRVFPLSQGADAHRHIEGRGNIGKVLLDCSA